MLASILNLLLRFPILPDAVSVVLLMVACGVLLHRQGPSQRLNRFLLALILTVPAHVVALSAAGFASHLRPYKLDLYVYRIDGLLGFQPTFLLGRLVMGNHPIMILLVLAYQLLPIAILAVFGAYLWLRPDREAMSMVPVFILNLALGVPLYLLFPVCGPTYAFPGFPALPGPFAAHPILLDAPPNGVPSVHFSTALLILWYARKLPLGRWSGAIYLVLIAAATMASGEHYLFDLVVAVPYAIAILALGNFVAARWHPKLIQS